MKRREFKGEITIFLSLAFLLIVSLIGSFMQSVTIQVNRSMKRADTKLATESVFAEYHPELFEQYGIFAKEGTDEEKLERRLWFYGAKQMEHAVCRRQLLSDNYGESFYEQAILTMGGVVNEICNISESTVLEEEEQNNRQLEQLLKEENQSLPKENNPIETIKEVKKSSLLELVLPKAEEVSSQYVELDKMPSRRNLEQGNKNFISYDGKDHIKKILFTQYLVEYFPNFIGKSNEKPLLYEAEYLLVGAASDQENLEAVAKKILVLRMALNYTYLLTDSERQAEAEALASTLATSLKSPLLSPIIKQAILFSWAYGESILDLRNLYKGEKTPVVKSAENWQLQLENLVKIGTEEEVKEEKSTETGMSYANYIEAFLLLEKKETLCMRALDLLELNLDIKVDACVTALEIQSAWDTQIGVKDRFLTEFHYK